MVVFAAALRLFWIWIHLLALTRWLPSLIHRDYFRHRLGIRDEQLIEHQGLTRSCGIGHFSFRSRHVDWLYPFWEQNFRGMAISTWEASSCVTMISNLVQNHILHWFKPVTFYPNLPKYTFYSEGIVNFMPTSDGEVEKPTAPVCRLFSSGPRPWVWYCHYNIGGL